MFLWGSSPEVLDGSHPPGGQAPRGTHRTRPGDRHRGGARGHKQHLPGSRPRSGRVGASGCGMLGAGAVQQRGVGMAQGGQGGKPHPRPDPPPPPAPRRPGAAQWDAPAGGGSATHFRRQVPGGGTSRCEEQGRSQIQKERREGGRRGAGGKGSERSERHHGNTPGHPRPPTHSQIPC